MKKDLKEFLTKDTHYFSESHLECWFKERYQGQTRKEIKQDLENEHDNSLEIDNAENELGRELNDTEKEKTVGRFIKSVLQNIEFRRGIAIGYYNSLNELNR